MAAADRIISNGDRLAILLFNDADASPLLEIIAESNPLEDRVLDIDSALILDLLSDDEIAWLLSNNKTIKSWKKAVKENVRVYI
jgi:hypothetical protein